MQPVPNQAITPRIPSTPNLPYLLLILFLFALPGILGQIRFMELQGYCAGYVGGRAKCTGDMMEIIVFGVIALAVVWAWRKRSKKEALLVLLICIVLGGWIRDGYRNLFNVAEHGLWADAPSMPVPNSATAVESWYPYGGLKRNTEFYTQDSVADIQSFYRYELAQRGWYCDTEYASCSFSISIEGVESASSFEESKNTGMRTIEIFIYRADENGKHRVSIRERDYRLISGVSPY